MPQKARQPNAGKLYEIARWNTASRKAIVNKTEIMNWKNLSLKPNNEHDLQKTYN
jgi:hypothetical protein